MNEYLKNNHQLQVLALFVSLPLLIWAAGDLPHRSLLKETLSVVTILACSLMIGLFYLSRANTVAVEKSKFSKLLNLHKAVGYVAVCVLLLHPFLLVVPRFFEAGVAPVEAFSTIVTTLTSSGVILGIIAWCLLFLIGITTPLRQRLPLQYRPWKVLHAILASACVGAAVWHVTDLGRHADMAMTLFLVLLSAGGLLLLLRNTLPTNFQAGEKNEDHGKKTRLIAS